MSSSIDTSLSIVAHNIHRIFNETDNADVETHYNYKKDGHGHEQSLEMELTIKTKLKDGQVTDAEKIAQEIVEVLQ